MYKNLYCKVYIKSSLEIEELFDFINSVVLGKKELIRTIKTDWGEMDLRKNSEYNNKNMKDFVYWPYYLDIQPFEGVDQYTYICNIKKFLEKVKMQGIEVVAACDFESDL